ncbi:MAG: FxLYD domain-containing protein [Clostridia bacterium]|nr:FxLYD domain-containing protein [Clostridia bacterium]
MSTMKKFFKYFLVFIIFFFLSSYLSNKLVQSTYKEKKIEIGFNSPNIEVTEAKSTKINGYIRGKITNNSNEKLTGKYVRADFYSPRGVNVGTKYIKIDELNPGEDLEFNEKYKFNDVDSVKFSIMNQEDKPEDKLIIEKAYDKLNIGKYKDIAGKVKDGDLDSLFDQFNVDQATREEIKAKIQLVKEEGINIFNIYKVGFPWYIWLAAVIMVFG